MVVHGMEFKSTNISTLSTRLKKIQIQNYPKGSVSSFKFLRDKSGILEVEDAGKYMRTFMKETHRKPRMSMRDYLTQFEVEEDLMQKAITQIVKDFDALSRRCRFALRVPSVSRRSLLVPRVGFPGLKKTHKCHCVASPQVSSSHICFLGSRPIGRTT